MIKGLHWFRNDLRLRDNSALAALTAEVEAWLPCFVLDPRLMGPRGTRQPPRVRFLLDCLERLAADLQERGIPLIVERGRPERVLPKLLRKTGASVLAFNEDISPFARARDAAVREAVGNLGARVLSRRDRSIYGQDEIRSGTGQVYRVFTPYRNAWWKRWNASPRRPRRRIHLPPAIPGHVAGAIPVARSSAAAPGLPTGGEAAARRRLRSFLTNGLGRYAEDRDRPDLDGTSRLSPYLRFGALSVRTCFVEAEAAAEADPTLRPGAQKWLDELVWREFYAGLLEAFPRLLRENQRTEYDRVSWRVDPAGFQAWTRGRTGFPIVDAGIRQLLATGWMHNRVRMIVASFLTKDLLIDWRDGERFFFEHLVDGEPASNSGGWQWAASTGSDAQPYFRVFNPTRQGTRWDPEGRYVRRWVPELRGLSGAAAHSPWEGCSPPRDYPERILDHDARRLLAIERFRSAREASRP